VGYPSVEKCHAFREYRMGHPVPPGQALIELRLGPGDDVDPDREPLRQVVDNALARRARVVAEHDEEVDIAAGDGFASGEGAKQVHGGDVGIRPVALFESSAVPPRMVEIAAALAQPVLAFDSPSSQLAWGMGDHRPS
jgi:hypothetical protein